MKREHRLRYIIKEGLLDTFYIWKEELRNVFKDAGVMIFFFLVPHVYLRHRGELYEPVHYLLFLLPSFCR